MLDHEALSDMVHDVLAAAAVLEMIENHFESNAEACRSKDEEPAFFRRDLLTQHEQWRSTRP